MIRSKYALRVEEGSPEEVQPVDRDTLAHYFDPARQDQSFSFRMREVTKLFTRAFTEDISSLGVTIGQWQCLRALWARDGRSQKELCAQLGISSAAAVFAVDLMERDGMATRLPHPTDGRSQLVYLTPKGKALKKKLLPLARDIQVDAAKDLTDEEISVFSKVLDQMKANLEMRLSSHGKRGGSAGKAMPRR